MGLRLSWLPQTQYSPLEVRNSTMLAPLPTRSVFSLRTFGRTVNPLLEGHSCQISEMLGHAVRAEVLSGPLLFKFQ
jgi:hypothetical protein